MRDFVERYDRETADPKWLLTSNVPTVDREVGANVERSVLERQIAHELLHNDNRPERGPATLTPVLCDDWLIFARDRDGAPYMVVTEMWSEWLDCPQGADHQPNALLTHMLPVAWEKGYPEWWTPVEPRFAADIPTEPLGGAAFWDSPVHAAPTVPDLHLYSL